MTGQTAACRHCGCSIEFTPAGWADAPGGLVCVKEPPGPAGHGKPGGFVLHEPMPGGLRGEPAPNCADCSAPLTVAAAGDLRYCRVDAGYRMAAGDPVVYDGNPEDGEPPRAETDCRGSGWYDCPCDADGPDGLCSCCRNGECNGSCEPRRGDGRVLRIPGN